MGTDRSRVLSARGGSASGRAAPGGVANRSLLAATALLLCACQGLEGPAAEPSYCPGPAGPITADTNLEPGCVYKGSFTIAASDVVLDCRNSRIDAAGKAGIVVGGKQGVSGVVIRNCRIANGGSGIYVGLTAPDHEKAAAHDRDTLYRITPHDIRIEGCTVEDSENVGIYVDDYVSRVTVARSTIRASGSAGIYLDHSSRENVIVDSDIVGNGYGKLPELRFGTARREGIAVDSSAHNRIEGNRISDNAAGGVFLYKNCHEHSRSDPASIPRWQPAEHNLIRGNRIDKMPVGVWLASRQSRDLSAWDCGDAPYFEDRYFLDHARHNTVEGNEFREVGTGVRVEDDFNAIIGNTFANTTTMVEISAEMRTRALGQPVIGTVDQGNVER